MANHIFLFPLLLIISSNFWVIISQTNFSSICMQTPYPDLCNPLTPQNGSPIDLFVTTLQETLVQAQNVTKLISNIDLSPLNNETKTALADCAYLYENSIYQLNRSLPSPTNQFDVQTWLTAATANEQTCLDGFIDFNMTSLLSQPSFLMLNNTNFSKFLSNALAINKAMSSSTLRPKNVPEWVSAGDRKLLGSASAAIHADVVVAQDGSGGCRTISAGLAAAARRRGSKRFVIYVKRGIYREYVKVEKDMKNIMVIGDGIDATIVTGFKSVKDGTSTFDSATFAIFGDGFIARGMTFENTAGAQKGQAVALLSAADLSVFYQCSFKGYQDTLYVHSHRQFYRDCDIYGTVDFIFGCAAAVIQNCNIYLRQPLPNQKNTITAQGRKSPNEHSGIIIHHSRVTSTTAAAAGAESYLGRPWRKYSLTVFMQCTIDGVIQPAGWLPWRGNFALDTLYYGEYKNTGGGANTGGRVKWPGLHVAISAVKAGEFTVGRFLAGNSWLPATGVPFTSGL